jgi:hypothetical protein
MQQQDACTLGCNMQAQLCLPQDAAAEDHQHTHAGVLKFRNVMHK